MSKERIGFGICWSEDNICNEIMYNPDIMWFDYPALFNKTINVILGKADNTNIRHTNFQNNKLALRAIFNSNQVNEHSLYKILSGDTSSYKLVLHNIGKLLQGQYDKSEFKDLTLEQVLLVNLNYKYISSMIIFFDDYYEHEHKYCFNLPSDKRSDLNKSGISKI